FSPLTFFFFSHAPPSSQLHTLSLHDALPISVAPLVALVGLIVLFVGVIAVRRGRRRTGAAATVFGGVGAAANLAVIIVLVGAITDRKSTRLNSSHVSISYAVFCLKKKKKIKS